MTKQPSGIPRSSTETIIGALRVLSVDIQTDDGVVNSCLREAADRMEELDGEVTLLRNAIKDIQESRKEIS